MAEQKSYFYFTDNFLRNLTKFFSSYHRQRYLLFIIRHPALIKIISSSSIIMNNILHPKRDTHEFKNTIF